MGTNELIITAASREPEVEVIMIMDVVTSHDEKFRSNRGSHRQATYCLLFETKFESCHARFIRDLFVRATNHIRLVAKFVRKKGRLYRM
jgi:hypothetical protein